MTEFELSLLHRIQDFATPLWDRIWTLITLLAEDGIVWILLAVVLFCIPRTRKIGTTLGLALGLGLLLGNGGLKNLFQRPRPYELDPTLFHRLQWVEMSGDYSFPSGHTQASFEAAATIFFYHKRFGAAAFAIASVVGLSRICLLLHYPTDVLGGAVCGIGFALLAYWLTQLLEKRFPRFFATEA